MGTFWGATQIDPNLYLLLCGGKVTAGEGEGGEGLVTLGIFIYLVPTNHLRG